MARQKPELWIPGLPENLADDQVIVRCDDGKLRAQSTRNDRYGNMIKPQEGEPGSGIHDLYDELTRQAEAPLRPAPTDEEILASILRQVRA